MGILWASRDDTDGSLCLLVHSSKDLMALNGLQSAKHKVSLRLIKSFALQVLGRKPKCWSDEKLLLKSCSDDSYEMKSVMDQLNYYNAL